MRTDFTKTLKQIATLTADTYTVLMYKFTQGKTFFSPCNLIQF